MAWVILKLTRLGASTPGRFLYSAEIARETRVFVCISVVRPYHKTFAGGKSLIMCEMPQGKQTVSDDEIIKAFDKMEGGFAFAIEIAEHFDHSRQWAHERMDKLCKEGELLRKQPGSQAVIYWPADN